jgi:hypothetical protein
MTSEKRETKNNEAHILSTFPPRPLLTDKHYLRHQEAEEKIQRGKKLSSTLADL